MPSTYIWIISSLGVVNLPRSALRYFTVFSLSFVPQIHCMHATELPPALPSGAFSTSFAPLSAAVMATDAPAPPKPMTTTSYSASHAMLFSNGCASSARTGAETRVVAATPSMPAIEPFRKERLEMSFMINIPFRLLCSVARQVHPPSDVPVGYSLALGHTPIQDERLIINLRFYAKKLFILTRYPQFVLAFMSLAPILFVNLYRFGHDKLLARKTDE